MATSGQKEHIAPPPPTVSSFAASSSAPTVFREQSSEKVDYAAVYRAVHSEHTKILRDTLVDYKANEMAIAFGPSPDPNLADSSVKAFLHIQEQLYGPDSEWFKARIANAISSYRFAGVAQHTGCCRLSATSAS